MSKQLYPHPECMAPDGADPCEGYHQALNRIADLKRQLQELEAGQQWVSVEDGLPDRDRPVLALHETGEIFHCRRAWNGEREVWAHAFVDAGISDSRFTHWMPLPAPPEDKSDE